MLVVAWTSTGLVLPVVYFASEGRVRQRTSRALMMLNDAERSNKGAPKIGFPLFGATAFSSPLRLRCFPKSTPWIHGAANSLS